MEKVILKVGGMSCSACQNRVEKYLNKQDGVSASVNLVMAQALIQYDSSKVDINDLERFIKESGYESLGIYNEKEEEKKDYTKYYLIFFAFWILLLMYVSMGHMIGLPVIPFLHMLDYPINYGVCLLILTIPVIIFGFDILKSGIVKLFHLSPNMDSLVSVGVLSSFIYSFINLILIILGNSMLVEKLFFESSAMIIYFIKLGRYIDNKSREKTKEAIKELVQITPEYAIIKRGNVEEKVTIDEVKKGDILICKPGEKIAVDGVIVKGDTHLDEAFITGEARPNKKKKGDKVIAGSINIDNYIEYKAERIGPDSTISEIVRLVVEATNTKAPIQRLADIICGYFVPGVFLISILTFIIYLILGFPFNEAIISFVTVLVVACPCALGLATPLAVVVSCGHAAREGILIKTSEILENAYKVDTIIFDKTGTLTYGDLRVSKIFNYSNYSDKKIIDIVSSLESCSTHPISTAFKSNKTSDVKSVKNISGIGLSGKINDIDYYVGNSKLLDKLSIKNVNLSDEEILSNNGNSIIYVVEDKKVIALIGVMDIVRDNVKDVVKRLTSLGKKVIMLSGDNLITAKKIADSIGINEVVADCLPQEKEKYLKELMNSGHKIMMVGDGINDAPSLATSDIGVSINSGTDIAANSSDVLLMSDNLDKIIELLNISSKTIKIIKENLFWAFFYNICMIPIAIGLLKPLGISISPMLASLAMMVSSLCVVFNSLRLRR